MNRGRRLRACYASLALLTIPDQAASIDASSIGTLAGQRIFLDGALADGTPVGASVQGDVKVAGSLVACASCHRRSGYGSSEGGTYVPPITGPTLFAPSELDRQRLFDKLFKEVQPHRFRSRMRALRTRPAYTAATLARAVTEGVDASDRALDPAMPRYQLGEVELGQLAEYLQSLGATQDPGVDAATIRFATIVTEGVDPAQRAAMLATIQAFFAWMNTDTRGDLAHPNFSPTYRTQFIDAYRAWQLDVWQLDGAPETWPAQLAERYARQPVFAVVSGLIDGPWQPIGEFCERERVACLFPHTALPDDPPGTYSLFFDRGLALEAEVAADYLLAHPAAALPIVQVAADDPAGRVPAEALARVLTSRGVAVETSAFKDPAQLPGLLTGVGPHSDLVLWPGRDTDEVMRALAAMAPSQWPAHVMLPGTAVEAAARQVPADRRDRLRFTYPHELPGIYQPQMFRIRAWMRSRGLEISDARLQFDTYYALTLLQDGLEHVADVFSRDYLIETIEHEAGKALNPGTYPRLGLGPGQRFASKGAYVVALGAQDGALIPLSDWIVPSALPTQQRAR